MVTIMFAVKKVSFYLRNNNFMQEQDLHCVKRKGMILSSSICRVYVAVSRP